MPEADATEQQLLAEIDANPRRLRRTYGVRRQAGTTHTQHPKPPFMPQRKRWQRHLTKESGRRE